MRPPHLCFMPPLVAAITILSSVTLHGQPRDQQPRTGGLIRRLDGSTISAQVAESIVQQLVLQHGITGLQVAIVNGGRLA